MKKQILVACLLITSVHFAAAQQWTRDDFRALGIARGVWLAELSNDGKYVEAWTIKNDSLMEGRAIYVTRDKREVLAETVQLVYTSGTIRYIVTTAGQNDEKPVAFTLVKKEARSFTFENKAHDFPQQIHYQFPKNNVMKATVSGPGGEGPKRIHFDFVKITGKKFER